jgi:hypothetical protein
MNFILDSQAKAEVRMAKHDEALARLEKQVKATANLWRGAIRIGARQLAEVREAQKQLAESQRVTDQKVSQLATTVDAFIRNFGNTENGH